MPNPSGRGEFVFADVRLEVSEQAWIADNATLIGNVTIGARSSVWFTAVLRADRERITIGQQSNLQDGVIVHADPGFPVLVGNNVSVGHRAVLHGCTIEDGALIGIGAVVLNGVHIGAGSLVAAGAVLLEGTSIPPASLVAGVPGKVRRSLTADEIAANRVNADSYARLAQEYVR
jgi:carbonic anhydrase/acetyltransferase-like protein (isoleucine patch superfamily)